MCRSRQSFSACCLSLTLDSSACTIMHNALMVVSHNCQKLWVKCFLCRQLDAIYRQHVLIFADASTLDNKIALYQLNIYLGLPCKVIEKKVWNWELRMKESQVCCAYFSEKENLNSKNITHYYLDVFGIIQHYFNLQEV